MANDYTDYYPSAMTEDIIDVDYEPVVVIGLDGNSLSDYENNEIVEEVIKIDLTTEHPDNVWCDNSVRYLINYQSQLKKQLEKCSDLNKKSLWQHVSERLIEHGFYFDAEACETKWRDLEEACIHNKTYTEDNNVIGDNLRKSDDGDYVVSTVAKYENKNIKNGRDNNKRWTIKSTRELIKMFGKYRKNFSAVNQGENNLLWIEISKRFSQLGYNYSANICHNKWRNLRRTFKVNKQKAFKYGPKCIKWCYYNDIEDIIRNDRNPSKETLDLNGLTTASLNDKLKCVTTKNDCQFNTNVNYQMPDDKVTENTDEIWTKAATKCLIKLWGLYRRHFLMATEGKKLLLWNKISDQLRKNGHNYSGLLSNQKWHILKANYFKMKEKYKKLDIISEKWPYYQDLDRLLGAPVNTIPWSTDSTKCLIDCFDHYKEKLIYASVHEKVLIWKKISEKMSQIGFYYSSKSCYNKWSSLKNYYIKNRMRFKRNKKVTWVYYNKIDSIFRGINKEKMLKCYNINTEGTSNQSYRTNELVQDNYMQTKPNSCLIKTDTITELKDMITSNYDKLNQKFQGMEDDLSRREKVLVDIGQQTLNALDKLNELETQLLRLLEQLILKLPNATSPQNIK